MRQAYLLERAWVDGAVHDDVLVEIEDGRFATGQVRTTGTAHRVHRHPAVRPHPPGLANCHSHAFHRALRGRTQRGRGTFWTWREQMYAVAQRLDPDSYFALARATYREMAAAGITGSGSSTTSTTSRAGHRTTTRTQWATPWSRPRSEAGIRIALLDTCYLSSGFGAPVEAAQLRYSDTRRGAVGRQAAQLRGDDTP